MESEGISRNAQEIMRSNDKPKKSSSLPKKSRSKSKSRPRPKLKGHVKTAIIVNEGSCGNESSELSKESSQKAITKKKVAGEFERKTKTAIQKSDSKLQPLKRSSVDREICLEKPSVSSGTVTASSKSDVVKLAKQKEAEARKEEKKMEPITSHYSFHGFRTDMELSSLLSKDGNWLLCFIVSSKLVPREACLAVRKRARIHKLKLRLQEDAAEKISFVVEAYVQRHSESNSASEKSFPQVEDMIDFYKHHDLVCKAKLGEAVVPSKLMLQYKALEFDKKRLLGTGNFGQVSEGKLKICANRKETGVLMEVKVAVKSSDEGEFGEPMRTEFRRKIVREASIMKQLDDCANVSLILGVCYDKPCLDVAVELCPGGSLFNHLVQYGKRISIEERLYYMYEITKGMKYIHKNNYLHRDLATRNCLVSSDGRIKISDFGLSCKISDVTDKNPDAQIARAPVRWMSPEAVASPPVFSFKSDVWSFGMCIYEIFKNGAEPWAGLDALQIKKLLQINQMPVLPKMPSEFRRIINQCWQLDCSLRPDFVVIYSKLKEERKRVKKDELRVRRSRFTLFFNRGVYCRSKEEMLRDDAYFRSIRVLDARVTATEGLELPRSVRKKSTNSSDECEEHPLLR